MVSHTGLSEQDTPLHHYVYAPLETGTSEIRILDLLSGVGDNTIECELRNVSLDSDPIYEALSYVWGDPKTTRPIKISGHQQQVTTNLAAALRQLRHPSQPRTLWVDALCINQADIVERGHQVEKMYTIYSKASHVISWLGEASEDSDEALDIIEEFGDFFRGIDVDLDDLSGGHKSLSSRLTSIGFPINSKNWKSVWNLFERPYWSRIWIIQELVSRGSMEPLKPCTICCGHKQIHKVAYNYASYCLVLMQSVGMSVGSDTGEYDEPIASLLKKGSSSSPALNMWQALAYCDGTWDMGRPSFRRFLDLTARYQATDARDKIYALLGMVPESQRVIRPDYTKSTRDLLIEYVKAFVHRENKLNAMLSTRLHMCPEAPSWTPEIHSNHYASDHWHLPILDEDFQASGNTKANVEFDDAKGLMRAKGVLVGEVSRVIGPQHNGDSISTGFDKVETLLVELGHVDVYRELAKYAHSLDETAYDAFWRTLILDHGESSPLEMQSRVYFDLESIPPDFHPELPDVARNISYILPYSQRILALMSHAFITTTTGHVGLGPYCAKVGDVVVVLYGCDRCVVLRPVENGHQVVGDAYLHGAMGGELLNAQNVDEKIFDLY